MCKTVAGTRRCKNKAGSEHGAASEAVTALLQDRTPTHNTIAEETSAKETIPKETIAKKPKKQSLRKTNGTRSLP